VELEAMLCPTCQTEARRFGKDRNDNQRYQCQVCKATFADRPARPLGDMRIDLDKAVSCLQLMLEGMSVRAIMRVTGTNRNTVLSLLAKMGERCERLLEGRIAGVPVVDVQCDEIWGFVKMKEKTRKRKHPDEADVGDAYCFVGIERETKLVLAWHLGKRSSEDTYDFADKLAGATSGRFQVTTDGWKPYQGAIPDAFPQGVDFGVLIKEYATKADEGRYSPGEVIGTTKKECCGNPDPDRICTSHVERQNLTMRMGMRRLTRLTNAHSKKWANHSAALSLHFAYYNLCRVHMTLKKTPAMAAGLEDHPWTLRELVEKSTHS